MLHVFSAHGWRVWRLALRPAGAQMMVTWTLLSMMPALMA